MSNPIDRQAAIRLITGYNGVMDKSVAKRLLIQMPSAQRWIPVTERLPEEKDAGRILKSLRIRKRSEYVLATVEVEGERMTVSACTYDGKWYWDMKLAFTDYKIIAWMPLPEPYEGGQDGNK